ASERIRPAGTCWVPANVCSVALGAGWLMSLSEAPHWGHVFVVPPSGIRLAAGGLFSSPPEKARLKAELHSLHSYESGPSETCLVSKTGRSSVSESSLGSKQVRVNTHERN